MLGDQVYADEPSRATRERLIRRAATPPAAVRRGRRLRGVHPPLRGGWGDPDVRWLLSTLPSSMIFDDHDVRDDWNTSRAWRDEMQATDWWEERITGALMSYWVYQHLGNLSPAGLAADETYRGRPRRRRRRGASSAPSPRPRTARPTAPRARCGRTGATSGGCGCWSSTRAAGRILADGDATRWSASGSSRWIEEQVEDGDYDHLVVGTSVPWLLPRALHDIESCDEALCAGTRGRLVARSRRMAPAGRRPRALGGLPDSFERLARLFRRIGRGEDGSGPGHDLRSVGRRPSHLRPGGDVSVTGSPAMSTS